MKKKTLKDIDLAGKRVIHRCDFNIKLRRRENGELVPISDVRLKTYFPSIFYLLNHDCRIVFMSWLERPGGKIVPELSMAPIAKRLSRLLNREVHFLADCIGEKVQKYINQMKPGQMVMLENTRFYPGEETDNDDFARQLSRNGDLMVQDAFGHCHRTHASVTGIPRHLLSVAGLYLKNEIKTFDKLIKNPQRPLILIIGGTKTLDKIKAIKNLICQTDFTLVGGAAANNFLKAKGINVGKSFLEEPSVDKSTKTAIDPVKEAAKLLEAYPDKIIIPIDLVAGDNLVTPQKNQIVNLAESDTIPHGWAFLDIGPQTVSKYQQFISQANTVFWDGPMGKYENSLFRNGTLKIAEAVASNNKTTILAGGDTAALAENFGLIFRYSHVSIAGGAALEYLAGNSLPGIEALNNQ